MKTKVLISLPFHQHILDKFFYGKTPLFEYKGLFGKHIFWKFEKEFYE